MGKISDDDDDDDDDQDDSTRMSMAMGKEPTTRATMKQGGTLVFTRKHGDKSDARL